MRFEELSKKVQNEEISLLAVSIKEKAQEEGIEDFDFPTYEEYVSFFNEFGEDYRLDGESTVEPELHNKGGIEFEGRKVILRVFYTEFDQE